MADSPNSCFEFCLPIEAQNAIKDSVLFLKTKATDNAADGGQKPYDYGIFGCAGNIPLAAAVCLCPCWANAVMIRNMERMSGHSCQVVCVNTLVTGAVCLGPCYYAHVRSKFRSKYGLSGSPMTDCLFGCCLAPCVTCSDANQLMVSEAYKVPYMSLNASAPTGEKAAPKEEKKDAPAS